MQTQGLGRQSEKICAKSAAKNIQIPHNLFGQLAQSAKTFGMCLKKTLLGVRSLCIKRFNFTEREIRCIHNS